MASDGEMAKYHKIWRVTIGSRDDCGPLADRPIRGSYLIESKFKNGIKTIMRRAMEMAAEDGIPNPIWMGMSWVNCTDTRFEEPYTDTP